MPEPTPSSPRGLTVVVIMLAAVVLIGIVLANQKPSASTVAATTTTAATEAAAPATAAPSSANSTADAAAALDASVPAEPVAQYAPPSAAQVARAEAEAKRVFVAEGLSGLTHYGGQCFEALSHGGTFGGLDFCLGFDAFAQLIAYGADPDAAQARGGYFATTQQRDLAAAAALIQGQGDPSARLADIRRIAGQIADAKAATANTVSAEPSSPPPAPRP